jgi:hypothetical protein
MENAGILYGHLEYFTVNLVYFMAIWLCCGYLVYFPSFWYIVSRKIWQPCCANKEETSHLFAHCSGLTQIRMRICGQPILDENFKWTPATLIAMIKEIDKICPEEGMVYDSANTQMHDDSRGPIRE